jgi:hypothetical protein
MAMGRQIIITSVKMLAERVSQGLCKRWRCNVSTYRVW